MKFSDSIQLLFINTHGIQPNNSRVGIKHKCIGLISYPPWSYIHGYTMELSLLITQWLHTDLRLFHKRKYLNYCINLSYSASMQVLEYDMVYSTLSI